jgi:hypothetical protein
MFIVTIYVYYMYRAPGSSEDVEISTERWPDKNHPSELLPLIGSVGHPTSVTPNNPDEHGEKRDFKVLEIKPPITADAFWREGSQETVATPSLVTVVVTDLD